jgi:hypothetical protein
MVMGGILYVCSGIVKASAHRRDDEFVLLGG